MLLEPKLGIGEIVIYAIHRGKKDFITDHMLQVLSIMVGTNSEGQLEYTYMCEHPATLERQWYRETDLQPDPHFNRETWKYSDDNDIL